VARSRSVACRRRGAHTLPPRARRVCVSVLQPHSSLTARENVALVTEMTPHPMTPEAALAMVDLRDRLDHFPAQLSGGEQQRVAIARPSPSVPTCSFATSRPGRSITHGQAGVGGDRRINTELGTTAAIITHNAAIARIADRVMHMADGRIAAVEANAEKVSPAEIVW